MIPGFRHDGGNFLPTFRDNLLGPIFNDQAPSPLNMGAIGFPETSVMNYHYSLRNGPEESSSPLLSPCLWESYITLLTDWVQLYQNIDL